MGRASSVRWRSRARWSWERTPRWPSRQDMLCALSPASKQETTSRLPVSHTSFLHDTLYMSFKYPPCPCFTKNAGRSAWWRCDRRHKKHMSAPLPRTIAWKLPSNLAHTCHPRMSHCIPIISCRAVNSCALSASSWSSKMIA
jgi:hypothetical protein